MYERILVPLDGSKMGEAALPYVEELISKLSSEVKVEVTLLRVVSLLTHYLVAGEAAGAVPYAEEDIEQIKKRARDYLDKAGEGLRGKGVTVKIQVEVGSPANDIADDIIRVADELNADLIAMSTHGRSDLSRWAFGSVTDKVLRGGHRPVLMVRTPKEAKKT